ncbi:hypothetical protein [Clostridium polynesiense]|uniref:hypothetical protein n=1 Tax=Clostridium polynesiense TaxID=1325933 RepID=UPI00059072A8|nr:hypothetical protein [Clostridium polynesiense]
MKYYININLFNMDSKNIIKDENLMECFQVLEKTFRLNNKLLILNKNSGEELCSVQALNSPLPEYKIMMKNKEAAQIKKNFESITKDISIKTMYGVFRLEGDIYNQEYSLINDLGLETASVSRKNSILQDHYVLTIKNKSYKNLILPLIVSIDYINYMENKKASPI